MVEPSGQSEVEVTAWEEARAAARDGVKSRMGPRTTLSEYLPSGDVSEADYVVTRVVETMSYQNGDDADIEDSDENVSFPYPPRRVLR